MIAELLSGLLIMRAALVKLRVRALCFFIKGVVKCLLGGERLLAMLFTLLSSVDLLFRHLGSYLKVYKELKAQTDLLLSSN
jgi:hypothetical protein